MYAIYKFDFHKNPEPTVLAAENGVDGSKNLKVAQACFASLFDKNSIDNLGKSNKKGEFTRLPNDVMAKQGDIYMARQQQSAEGLVDAQRQGQPRHRQLRETRD